MVNGKPDKILLGSIFSLIIFGLMMIASAGIIYSQTRFGDQYYFFRRQFFWGILPGLAAFYFLQRIDYHFWKKFAVIFFLISLVLLVLVFVPSFGIKTYGASRWLQLGPVSFQPSEALKLTIILYLALWLENKGIKRTKDFFEGLMPFLVVLGIVGFLVVKQPDLGTLGVVVLVSLAIFFAAGAKLSHLLSMVVAGFLGLFALIKLEPYRFDRFLTFLNPQADPQGIGYHINQALIAIGSGGIWGVGLGHSRQKFNYLPEPAGDSIFAIIGEELGMIGVFVLIALFATLAMRGFRIAKNAPDEFGKLVAVGITSWIIFQAFINIGSITAMIPLTGVPLPFISYGGTSLVFLLAASGILLNISKQSKT
jgi:cell division protein FtsW